MTLTDSAALTDTCIIGKAKKFKFGKAFPN